MIDPEHDQPGSRLQTSRREFLGGAAAVVVGLSAHESTASDVNPAAIAQVPGFHDLRRTPDGVMVQTATGGLQTIQNLLQRFRPATYWAPLARQMEKRANKTE